MSSSRPHPLADLLISPSDLFHNDAVSSTFSYNSWSAAELTSHMQSQSIAQGAATDRFENFTATASSASVSEISTSTSDSSLHSRLTHALSEVSRAFFAYFLPFGVLLSLFNNASTVFVLRRRRLVRAMSKTVWSLFIFS